MILLSRHSDRTLERRWHAAGCAVAGAAALALLPVVGSNFPLTLVALTVATVSVFSAMPILFSIPMTLLSPRAAPGGIALINSIGQTGGFLSPFMLGWVKTTTGSLNIGLYIIAMLLGLGAVIMVNVVRTSPKQIRGVDEDAVPGASRATDL
jgi:MFS-type transporter involved in bile tolerance (Atg22 family)